MTILPILVAQSAPDISSVPPFARIHASTRSAIILPLKIPG